MASRKSLSTQIAIPANPKDPEDFDITIEGLDCGQRARLVRIARRGLHLSRAELAGRLEISVEVLICWERAQATVPDDALRRIKEMSVSEPVSTTPRRKLKKSRGPKGATRIDPNASILSQAAAYRQKRH